MVASHYVNAGRDFLVRKKLKILSLLEFFMYIVECTTDVNLDSIRGETFSG